MTLKFALTMIVLLKENDLERLNSYKDSLQNLINICCSFLKKIKTKNATLYIKNGFIITKINGNMMVINAVSILVMKK